MSYKSAQSAWLAYAKSLAETASGLDTTRVLVQRFPDERLLPVAVSGTAFRGILIAPALEEVVAASNVSDDVGYGMLVVFVDKKGVAADDSYDAREKFRRAVHNKSHITGALHAHQATVTPGEIQHPVDESADVFLSALNVHFTMRQRRS